MRALLRLEDGRVVTLWCPDECTCDDLKLAALQTGRTALQLPRLLHRHHELSNGSERLQDAVLRTGCPGQQRVPVAVPLVLRRRRADVRRCAVVAFSYHGGCGEGVVSGSLLFDIKLDPSVSAVDVARAIEVRTADDVHCKGCVTSYDAERRVLSCCIADGRLLAPSTQHVVYLSGDAVAPLADDEEWTFTTRSLCAIRVLVRQRGESGEERLLMLHRRTESLLAELRSGVASVFRCSPHHVVELRARRRGEDELCLDADCVVALLDERYDVSFSLDRSMVLAPDDVPMLDYETYCEEHYADPRCACYAVCGKMSAEEENAILLEVVQAFGAGDDLPVATPAHPLAAALPVAEEVEMTAAAPSSSPTAAAAPRATTSTDAMWTRSQLADAKIPPELRRKLWPPSGGDAATAAASVPPRVHCVGALDSTALLEDLQRRGFSLFRIDPSTHADVQRCMDAAEAFFARPYSAKRLCVHQSTHFVGYRDRLELFSKELFTSRLVHEGGSGNGLWGVGADIEQLRDPTLRAMASLGRVAQHLLRATLGECGVDPAYAESLCELCDEAELAAARREIGPSDFSTTNFTLFRYAAPENGKLETVHCPHHSDVSLVTVIPCCRTAPGGGGLHVYDWSSDTWVDVEDGAPADVAVVFGGETLARVTGGRILPAMHEVSNVGPGVRLSTPLQLCAPPGATLIDPSEDPKPPVLAEEFMNHISASRISSNFPRLV